MRPYFDFDHKELLCIRNTDFTRRTYSDKDIFNDTDGAITSPVDKSKRKLSLYMAREKKVLKFPTRRIFSKKPL